MTHGAFCDALAEENNKVNQELINNDGSNIQAQMPELMSSMPMNMTTNTSLNGASNFNNSDHKNQLKSLSQDPVLSMPMNMTGGMFSTSSGTLFGGPRTSSSSSLQLSSNSSSGAFHHLLESKKGCQIFGSAHMSATALLQKAAQIGATGSNSTINSPMIHKSFAGSMVGHDHQHSSSSRPPYTSVIQQHSTAYDYLKRLVHDTECIGLPKEYEKVHQRYFCGLCWYLYGLCWYFVDCVGICIDCVDIFVDCVGIYMGLCWYFVDCVGACVAQY
ncbi:zinc finger protein JACKDAW-like isoform X2 [Juglans regia]|nr:zinc finger protein JACKDAW-like isoform X2 [Juglans regia]